MARRIRATEYNGNIYFTSNKGILKLEGPTNQIKYSGIPKALNTQVALIAPAGSGIFVDPGPNFQSYAYRALWGITDANNNLNIGAPSNPVVINYDRALVAADRDVEVTVQIPQFITTAHFFQIYRTKRVDDAAAFINPGDEMFLVYEGNPDAAEIAARTLAIVDIRPDLIVGESLYTNASQQGIQQANLQPPLAADITIFKDYCFFSNTTQKQRLYLSLIGLVNFTAGVSTITIGATTYNCVLYAGLYSTSPLGENAATNTFVYYTGGSVAENIRGTAESLCRVINASTTNTEYYGFYESQLNETPGIMLIEERLVGGAQYNVTAQATIIDNFEPKLQTAGTLVHTANDYAGARLYFSKFQQPEAVPQLNYFNVGARNDAIQRILPLRDSLIIVKQFATYRLTGTSEGSFAVSILDNTISINDRYDSCAILNNQVMALSNQGPVAISDTGVQLIGRPEEFDITFGTVSGDGFSVGIGHEQLRIYVLSTFDPEFKQQGNTYPYSCFVYNIVTQSWTRWLINSNCFAVLNDKLFYGLNNTAGNVLEQRQYGFDFYDEKATATVSAISLTNKTAVIAFTASVDYKTYYSQFGYVDGFGEGWVIVDAGNRYLVTAWNAGTTTATFNTVLGLANGAKDCYRPIPEHVEWMPCVANNPATVKQFDEIVLTGAIDDTYKLRFEFANEQDPKKYFFYYSYLTAPVGMDVLLNDTDVAWNQEGATRYRRVRTLVPKTKQMGGQLSVRVINNVAGSRFAIKSLCVGTRTTNSDNIVR